MTTCKLAVELALSPRALEQLNWLVDNLFTTYCDNKSRQYFVDITIERAISDMYELHVKDL